MDSHEPSLNINDFEADPRMYISKETGKWRFERDDDGPELEYDMEHQTWVELMDNEELIRKQQQVYSIPGVNEEIESARERKLKRKQKRLELLEKSNLESSLSKKQKFNTGVYVTGLPMDINVDEIIQVFGKCGIIMDDMITDGPKVKIYTDNDGNPRGDALIIYLRDESVQLAIDMLDDTEFRYGMKEKMKVSKADYSKKLNVNDIEENENKKKGPIDKEKIKRKMKKMKAKLEGWSDEEDDLLKDTNQIKLNSNSKFSKFSKTVILKYMFTLEKIKNDPTFALDLAVDIREECELLGKVTKVTLYDKEEEGIVAVRFLEESSARACVVKMKGRFFDGQKVDASLWNGKRYEKTKRGDDHDHEDERLEAFGNWIETDTSKTKKKDSERKDSERKDG